MVDERVGRSGKAGVLMALVIVGSWALGGTAFGLSAPPVPAAIAVPAGHVAFLAGHATGFQVYQCQAANGAHAWTLVTPLAGLTDERGALTILHFAGPTWQARADGSKVVGARVAGVAAPIPNAIPWLLVSRVSSTGGPRGSTLTPTTFIQRINTTGGVAPPAAGCGAAQAGTTASVPYTADYYFFRAA